MGVLKGVKNTRPCHDTSPRRDAVPARPVALVDSGGAARPLRRVAQAVARRVARYIAWSCGKVAVVGRVEPRDLAREV